MSFGVLDGDGQVAQIEGHPFGQIVFTGQRYAAADVRLLSPILPSKVVCIGKNYADHVAEMAALTGDAPKAPLIFLKPSTSVIGPGEAIRLPPGAGRVDHEAEAGIVIRRRAYRVPASRAHEYVLGVTCVNDVTARDIQRRENQYTRPKGFDTFAPLGPAIAVGLDTADLEVQGLVNGSVRQHSSTRQLIFPVADLVAFISGVMTLLPGDIISTGTPAGIGPLAEGDVVTVRVSGVGDLVNPVVQG